MSLHYYCNIGHDDVRYSTEKTPGTGSLVWKARPSQIVGTFNRETNEMDLKNPTLLQEVGCRVQAGFLILLCVFLQVPEGYHFNAAAAVFGF